MMPYLVEPIDRIFAKGYGFFTFVKNMSKNIGKKIIKDLTVNIAKNLLDHDK